MHDQAYLRLTTKNPAAFATGLSFVAECDKISNLRLAGDISKIVEFSDNNSPGKWIQQLIKVDLDKNVVNIRIYPDKNVFLHH